MFRNRGYGRSTVLGGYVQPQQDIVSEIFEVEALEDLAEGDIEGFVEDEILADIF